MKFIRWLIFCLAIPSVLWAQDVRHLKGMKDFRVGGGLTKLGYYGNLGFGYNLSSKINIGGDLMYEAGNLNGFLFSSSYLMAGLNFNPFNINETLYLNVGAGLIGSFTSLNELKGLKEETKKTGFNVGAYAGPELDFFLSNRIILNAYYRQAYLPMSYMGTMVYFIGGGLKFSIN
jgi:hypothetical protein